MGGIKHQWPLRGSLCMALVVDNGQEGTRGRVFETAKAGSAFPICVSILPSTAGQALSTDALGLSDKSHTVVSLSNFKPHILICCFPTSPFSRHAGLRTLPVFEQSNTSVNKSKRSD